MTDQLDAGFVAEQVAEHPEALSSPYGGGELGRGRRRKEDAKLVTGQTNWTDNITLPGLLHMAVLRSPMAHARIVSVDVSAALEMPGVIAAYSGADLADVQGARCPAPGRSPRTWSTPTTRRWRPTRCATSATASPWWSPATATPPPTPSRRSRSSTSSCLAVVDMEAALAEGADLVHADKGTNSCFTWPFASGDSYEETVAAAGDDAVVVRRRFRQQRLLPDARWSRAASWWRRSRRPTSTPSTPRRRSRTSCG